MPSIGPCLLWRDDWSGMLPSVLDRMSMAGAEMTSPRERQNSSGPWRNCRETHAFKWVFRSWRQKLEAWRSRAPLLLAGATEVGPGHKFQPGFGDRTFADITHPKRALRDSSQSLFDCSQ